MSHTRDHSRGTTFSLNCPRAKAAFEALQAFSIPTALFNHHYDKCYCLDCEPVNRARSDGCGGIPRGFTRFATYVPSAVAESRGTFSRWPKAYHGTKQARLSSIAKLGYLLIPGCTPPEGKPIAVRDGHIKTEIDRTTTLEAVRSLRRGNATTIRLDRDGLRERFDPATCVFVSPHYAYAAHPVYAEATQVHGKTTVALLEFRILREAFDEGSHTLSDTAVREVLEDEFSPSDDSWEWFSKRLGVMTLTGVLVRVDQRARSTVDRQPASLPRSLDEVPADYFLRTKARETFTQFLQCKTARRRFELLRILGLPPSLFNEEHFICYCKACQPDDGRVFTRAGRSYRLPHGFTGFSLHVDTARVEMDNVFQKWPVAYHGTTIKGARGIINAGIMLPSGATGPDGNAVQSRDAAGVRTGRTIDCRPSEAGQIFFSPLVDYASHPVHATPARVVLRGAAINLKVALQLRVRPDFSTHPSTVQGYTVHPLQAEYQGEEEWYTPRHGSVLVYRLLISDDH